MKVVIDTNVLVSAALKDKDPEAVILWIVTHSDWQWVISPAVLTEYKEVLSRKKFGLTPELLQKWFELLEELTTSVEVGTTPPFPRDRKDAIFLACAAAADADYFITGDKDFVEAKKLLATTIISVGLFKKLVCDSGW